MDGGEWLGWFIRAWKGESERGRTEKTGEEACGWTYGAQRGKIFVSHDNTLQLQEGGQRILQHHLTCIDRTLSLTLFTKKTGVEY